MNKKRKILLFICLFFLLLGSATFFFFPEKSAKTIFLSEKVQLRNLSTAISASGTLEPVDQVEIGTQVSGDIAKIYVDFNSSVKKGQVLAELDKSKLQAILTQSLIALKSAENDYEYKKSVYERTEKLAKTESASQVDLESALYNYKTAKFQVEQRKNEVAEAKLNLSYCVIKSPIQGIVLERSVDVGQTVAASMSAPTLFILAKDLTQMKVMASVDEADIGLVKPGQKVEFTVDAFPNKIFHGKVLEVRLNPTITSNVVTYTVVIAAQNETLELLPGMTATCTIITQEVQSVPSISLKALKFKPSRNVSEESGNFAKEKRHLAENEKQVFVQEKERLKKVFVKTGISDGVYIQITEGLTEGDSLINEEFQEEVLKQKKSDNTTNPFMPEPPGKRKR